MSLKNVKPMLTPKGIFRFPKLTTPDEFKGKLTYNSGLVVDPDAPGVKDFIAKLEAIRDTEVEKVKAALIAEGKGGAAKKIKTREVFKPEEDKEGNETGNIVFSTKMNAEYKDRKTGELKQLKPLFFDSRGQAIAAPKNIWGGTIGRFGVKPSATLREADSAYGVTLYLDAVFIIDLKSGGERDASYYGFEGEDGGYTGNDSGYNVDDDDDDVSPARTAAAGSDDDTDF